MEEYFIGDTVVLDWWRGLVDADDLQLEVGACDSGEKLRRMSGDEEVKGAGSEREDHEHMDEQQLSDILAALKRVRAAAAEVGLEVEGKD